MRYIVKEKIFHITEDSVISDEAGNPQFQVNGAFFSIHNRLEMQDVSGNKVAVIYRKLLAIGATYEVELTGRPIIELHKQLFTFFGDRFTVTIPGEQNVEISGNFTEHEFVFTRSGATIAQISKQWFSFHETYGVDVQNDADAAFVLACSLAIDMIEDSEK